MLLNEEEAIYQVILMESQSKGEMKLEQQEALYQKVVKDKEMQMEGQQVMNIMNTNETNEETVEFQEEKACP